MPDRPATREASEKAFQARMDTPPDPPATTERDMLVRAAWRRFWRTGANTGLIELGIMSGNTRAP